jgi:hypothetical protein
MNYQNHADFEENEEFTFEIDQGGVLPVQQSLDRTCPLTAFLRSSKLSDGLSNITGSRTLDEPDSDDESIGLIDIFGMSLMTDDGPSSSGGEPAKTLNEPVSSVPGIFKGKELVVALSFQGPSLQTASEHAPQKYIQRDSPLQAFLRLKKHDNLSNSTPQTSTTFATSYAPSDDEQSMGSIDDFDSLSEGDDVKTGETAVDRALRITEETVSGFQLPPMHGSGSSLHSAGAFVSTRRADELSTVPDSMSSLNSSFEKLSSCMERTAETRRMVRQFSKKSLITLSKADSQRSLTRLGSHQSRSLHDSNESFSSSGTANASFQGSKSGVTKVNASYKMKTRNVVQRDHKPLIRGLLRP